MTTTVHQRQSPRLLAGVADYATHLQLFGPTPRLEPGVLIDELERSGLAGRGGASFPAWRKLALAHGSSRSRRRPLVVVNAMEGEPASDKCRVLLTQSTHLVLDGAEIVGTALGASEIVVCIPSNREGLAHRADAASSARDSQLPVTTLRLPPRYVAGEETALAAAIGGDGSLPRYRPDKAIPLQIGGSPVLVHNLETLAHVAFVARYGARWWRTVGSEEAPGTCLITLSGDVSRPGVIEVPTGVPLVDLLSAGVPAAPPQAALVGGYGGSWVGVADFATAYSPAALRAIGASMGPGIVVALSGDGCGVRETARIARYMAVESAAQCGPCLFGLPALASDLEALADGHAGSNVLQRLEFRCWEVDGRGACRHPDGVVRVVRSGLQVFAADVAAHAAGRPCPGSHRPTVLTFPQLEGSGR
jgi:NADH:ubiquinone oxidoreductase subunit F (NADH-binding)